MDTTMFSIMNLRIKIFIWFYTSILYATLGAIHRSIRATNNDINGENYEMSLIVINWNLIKSLYHLFYSNSSIWLVLLKSKDDIKDLNESDFSDKSDFGT